MAEGTESTAGTQAPEQNLSPLSPPEIRACDQPHAEGASAQMSMYGQMPLPDFPTPKATPVAAPASVVAPEQHQPASPLETQTSESVVEPFISA